MIKFQEKYLIASLIIFMAFFITMPVFAANLFIESTDKEININEQFEVNVFLNTEKGDINAIEGNIIFPEDLLELKEIRIANSIISLWIEKPNNDFNDNIVFSGIIPGGYQEEKGLVLSLMFLSKKNGQGVIEIKKAKTLLNDGLGTEDSLLIFPYDFIILKTMNDVMVPQPIDKEPPEIFLPEISQEETLFDGKSFIVFVTQDKFSDVDHYEIKEVRQIIFEMFTKWVPVESPYVLSDQELRSFVFVKAIDKFGNERIVRTNPQNPLKWYEDYGYWIIIILLIYIINFIIKKLLRKKRIKK